MTNDEADDCYGSMNIAQNDSSCLYVWLEWNYWPL